MKKNYCILFFLLFVSANLFAQSGLPPKQHLFLLNTENTPMHRWNFECTHKKYPDRGEASAFTYGRRVNVEICSAEQTMSQFFHHQMVTAYTEISTFKMIFKVKNFLASQFGSKLLIGDKKTYSLYTNCNPSIEGNACVFSLANAKRHSQILKEMAAADHFIVRVYEKESKEPLDLVFSLRHFNPQIKKIFDTEKQLRAKFKNAFNMI